MTVTGETNVLRETPYPTATLSTTNPRWKAPGIRPWPQRHDAAAPPPPKKKKLADGLRNES